jgi:oligoendopeptidase F
MRKRDAKVNTATLDITRLHYYNSPMSTTENGDTMNLGNLTPTPDLPWAGETHLLAAPELPERAFEKVMQKVDVMQRIDDVMEAAVSSKKDFKVLTDFVSLIVLQKDMEDQLRYSTRIRSEVRFASDFHVTEAQYILLLAHVERRSRKKGYARRFEVIANLFEELSQIAIKNEIVSDEENSLRKAEGTPASVKYSQEIFIKKYDALYDKMIGLPSNKSDSASE